MEEKELLLNEYRAPKDNELGLYGLWYGQWDMGTVEASSRHDALMKFLAKYLRQLMDRNGSLDGNAEGAANVPTSRTSRR